MESAFTRPLRLRNRIQNYDWGTKNEDAFIPHFARMPVTPDIPYAEMWIGAHPSAPSDVVVGGNVTPLDDVIEDAPLEILGEYVARKFSGRLPFLLKILSAERALSIQAHPNREQAKRLHAADPAHYPDDNHKPEIAIALDSLTAIAGFRPVREIVDVLRRYPELQSIAGRELVSQALAPGDETRLVKILESLYAEIMRHADDAAALRRVIGNIVGRLSGPGERSEEERLFLEQHELYGDDVGLLSILFFNLVHLKPRQAIYTGPGVPHAYIRGNIIECMANSDNVVRGGLTGKFKDVPSLLDILTYQFARYPVLNGGQQADGVVYRTGAEEFEITGYQKSRGYDESMESGGRPVVLLVTSGSLDVRWGEGGGRASESFLQGESFLIPASFSAWRVSSRADAGFYAVRVP